MKETHFLPFFCGFCHPTNCQGRGAKICGVSGSGDESLVSKRGTKCTQKRPCPEMHGFCNFAVFVDEKSRASEHVKRDPHVFDLVPFFCAFAILQIVKDVSRKYVAFQVLAMNLLRRNVVQNERKRPCPEMHGFCNFAVFVDEKSRALEPWAVQNIQKGKKVV